jgi:hypothetical protein
MIIDSLRFDSLYSSTPYNFLVRARDSLGNSVDDSIGISGVTTRALADFNGDGKIDANDLKQFVAAWPNTDSRRLAFLTPVDSTPGFPRMRVLPDARTLPDLDDFFMFSRMWIYSKLNGPPVALGSPGSGGKDDPVIRRELTARQGDASVGFMVALPPKARFSGWGVRAYYGPTLDVDSMMLAGGGFALAFKDTGRKIFYADCALAGGRAIGGDTLVKGVINLRAGEHTDSVVVVFEGVDTVTGKMLRYTEIYSVREVPSMFVLRQNYPNPFNPSTTISFDLPADGRVSLVIYDVLGRVVRTLLDEYLAAGFYRKVFDGRGLATGVYFYRLHTGYASKVEKMLLLK